MRGSRCFAAAALGIRYVREHREKATQTPGVNRLLGCLLVNETDSRPRKEKPVVTVVYVYMDLKIADD